MSINRKKRPLAYIITLIRECLEAKGFCRILAPGNGATCEQLDAFICKEAPKLAHLGRIEYVQILPLGSPERLMNAGDAITSVTCFPGQANRDAVNNGLAKFYFDDLSRAVEALGGKWHSDIVIGHAADEQNGYYTITLDGSLIRTGFLKRIAGERTKRVLLVNARMPKAAIRNTMIRWFDPVTEREANLYSGCAVEHGDVDYIIHIDAPLPNFSMKGATHPAWMAMAKHIVNADLIIPGKTDIQAGIGGADAIWHAASEAGISNVGLDSELASDGIVEAIKRGVLTGRNKEGVLYGKHVVGILAGTQTLYDFVRECDDIYVLPQEWVNTVHRQRSEHAFSFNAALGWTPFGEVFATSRLRADGTVMIQSASGGQAELIRAIRRQRHGVSVIGTTSTYVDENGDEQSSIVPFLNGQFVTTTKETVDWLVTEHGIVHVAHNEASEVAQRIISIAAPQFRDDISRRLREKYPFIRNQWSAAMSVAA